MRRTLAAAVALLALAPAAFAGAHEGLDEATVEQITAKLAEMNCQMDPDDIEVTEAGFELDDVICEGGNQFDIELDKDLNETGRRAE